MDLVQALWPRPSDHGQHHEPLAGKTGLTGPVQPDQALRVRTYRAAGRPLGSVFKADTAFCPKGGACPVVDKADKRLKRLC